MPSVLPYHEPTLVNLLICSSFLYFLNIIRVAADYLVHGGIVSEITLGIIYGSPLAGILPLDWEATFTVFGYIALILVVFEGGLSSNLPMLFSNLPLSMVCAITGIIFPIALSFASLYAGFGYKPLEAFAAGAALSSDSLGTTLAALNSASKASSTSSTRVASGPLPLTRTLTPTTRVDTSATLTLPRTASVAEEPESARPAASNSLKQSRIGTVLISAAIIDDVVGLVVASVMPALALVQSETEGAGGGSIAWPVVRPLLASVLMACIAPLVARFILRPLFWHKRVGERWCAPAREEKSWGFHREGWGTDMHADAAKLFVMVGALSAMSTISHYAGTSVLFGAYITGLMLTYISQPPPSSEIRAVEGEKGHYGQQTSDISFEATFARILGPAQEYVLLPMFFASIGFAIPFLDLWKPTIIWRGIVYSILMCLAKLAVGVPILLYGPYLHHFPSFSRLVEQRIATALSKVRDMLPCSRRRQRETETSIPEDRLPRSSTLTVREPDTEKDEPEPRTSTPSRSIPTDNRKTGPPLSHRASTSIPAAAFMGAAMVARGEIGLLIAQLARSGGEGTGEGDTGVLSEEPFLLCIWAILTCTLVGPVGLGFAVRRWGPLVNAGIWA
ncbi:hypothetical protein C8Q79DRAFT_1002230 [Trametes meyenii]|nr:hypothetical protein C8Q79DRAFT_1002230 [Trametes meyenii]